MTRWQIYKLDRRLGKHASGWDELRLRLFDPNPMLSSRFINGLLEHFGDGSEHLCVATDANNVVRAMCILRPERSFLWRSFLPSQAQVGPTLIGDPVVVHSLFAALPASVGEIDLLCSDENFGDLPNRSFKTTHCLDHALTMHIDLRGSFAEYWAACPKKLQQNITRYRRRCAASGKQERFLAISAADEMPAAISRYAALEASGWKGNTGTDLGSDPNQRRFYEQLLTGFASHGAAYAWELWHDDRLVASRLAIVERDCLVMLKTTYSESQAEFAPGRVLLSLVIEHAYKLMPGGRIEFYTDATADQLKWASGSRWIRHLSFYRYPAVKLLASSLRASKRIMGIHHDDGVSSHAIKVYRRVDELPASAQQLLDDAQHRDYQFGSAWYRNLVVTVFDHIAETEVRFYTLEIAGTVGVVLPVALTRRRGGAEITSLSNYYTSLYAPILHPGLKGRQLVPLIRRLLADQPHPGVLQFSPMAPSDPSFRTLLSCLRLANLVCFPYFCFDNWYQPVQTNWATYLQGREGRLRSTISRMGKKFAAEGGRLEIIPNDDFERGLHAYEAVYAASWKQPEPYKEFIPGLIRLCAQRGWLRLAVAWLGDKPIAAQIWILVNGKADIYKLAYDETYKAYSPGTLLTAVLMEQAMDVDKASEIDYLIGADTYKQLWMDQRRERWGMVAYNPRTLRGVLGIATELLGRLTKSLRVYVRKVHQACANGSAAAH